MALKTRLRFSRLEVERILKHFLNSGHQYFHFAPNQDPGLKEAEARFETWTKECGLALKRCFTTNDIVQGFNKVPSLSVPNNTESGGMQS